MGILHKKAFESENSKIIKGSNDMRREYYISLFRLKHHWQ